MATPHPLALPTTLSPDDLEALSELALVLTKVRAGIQSASGLTTTGATPGGTTSTGNGQQLSFKEVPGATDGLKHKIQHARAQVRTLPDMGRTITDQTVEMRELEARIEAQRALLERLREGGVNFGKDNQVSGDRMET
jgi:hypothetical protein